MISGLFLKLHPASGTASPSEAETRPDAPGTLPGHLLANVIVPKGGPGAVDVVVRDQTDLPIHVGGVGPPPGAPLSSLVLAQVHVPIGAAMAGRPTDVVIDVRPQVDWDPPLGLPDRLVVIATLGRGPDLANAEIRRVAGSTTTYAGPITIPEAGDVTLLFAFPGGTSGPDDVIGSATTRLNVGTVVGSPTPTAAEPAASSDVPWLPIAVVVILVAAAGLVIRRVFADL